ncbi:MAG: AlkA N-terminal domain-containing protein [Candidatus Krumholzibacteriia bacterium]
MELDHATCYRAVQARDRRFDGRFFTGVRTTGIYCRPVCPAVTPRARNVEFFACAAAAEQAGFRPCRRCRPETAPGTPAWQGTAATVTRALRLIGEGALDGRSVPDLAARLGLGGRQLGRLFREHLGTTPVAVAQTRRAHFARLLLEQGDLPLAQVALAAGFGSLRRFNAVMRSTFGVAPGALRQAGTKPRKGAPTLVARLVFRPPYAWDELLAFLAARAIPGVEAVAGDAYRRTIVWDGRPGLLTVRPGGPDHLRLEAELAAADGAAAVVARVRRMFDCDADPAAIAAHLGADPLLARSLARRPGLRLPSGWDPFETAVRAVLGQQVSVAAATTVAGRLVRRCGSPLPEARDGLTHLFPTPRVLVAADLSGLGLTSGRAATVAGLARAVAGGAVGLNADRGPDELAARLGALPGIGPWTAAYVGG